MFLGFFLIFHPTLGFYFFPRHSQAFLSQPANRQMNNLIPISLYHREGNIFSIWWILMVIVLSVFESITVGDSAIFLKLITRTFNTHVCAAVVIPAWNQPRARSVILSMSVWDKWLTRSQKRENIHKQWIEFLSIYYWDINLDPC